MLQRPEKNAHLKCQVKGYLAPSSVPHATGKWHAKANAYTLNLRPPFVCVCGSRFFFKKIWKERGGSQLLP